MQAGGSTIPAGPLCCGLTWISTGQLAHRPNECCRGPSAGSPSTSGLVATWSAWSRAARRYSARDAAELFPHDQDVAAAPRSHGDHRRTAQRAHAWLAAAPARRGKCWPRSTAISTRLWAGTADAALLAKAGACAEHLESGCCGLAGQLRFPAWPQAESAGTLPNGPAPPHSPGTAPGTVVLADGFSCRTQIHELDSGGREAMHLAELLAAAGDLDQARPETRAAPRPASPSRAARVAVLGAAVLGAGALAAAAARAARAVVDNASLVRRRPFRPPGLFRPGSHG